MIRCTLVCDGPSDRALIPIFEWSLWQLGVKSDLESVWADLRGVQPAPVGLAARISKAIELYPCEIVFVHRDSENVDAEVRRSEIADAIRSLNVDPPHVCVIPVKMLESWLLFSESAIRQAAGNPEGRIALEIPRPQDLEFIADPKSVLFELLRTASELSGRRLRSFGAGSARTLVSQYSSDFSMLRLLPAFNAFEAELKKVIATKHYDTWI